MLAVVIATAVLIYGGITSFVVIFAIFPIALVLFEKADIPVRLIPGIATLGLWSFAMTGPASTQIQNIIPMNYLHTGPLAGLLPGAIGAVLMFALGVLYMIQEEKKARKKGEHFAFPDHVKRISDDSAKPAIIPALIPILFVIVTFNVFNMNIVLSLLFTDIIAVALFYKFFPKGGLLTTLNEGAVGSITVIINTAAVVGFGSISKLTPFYEWAIAALTSVQMNPYVLSFVTTNAFAGLMGSSSGSLGLTYGALGETFLKYGEMGYNLEFIHRLSSVGAAGLDTLPYCGAIVSVLNVCGVSHKEGYFPIFVNCTVIPILVGRWSCCRSA
jgi:H+/gluconate symporter-like permease